MCGSRSALCMGLSIILGSMTLSARGDEVYSRVEVMLTATSNLPAEVRAWMTHEAAAIWRAQGVAIDWFPSTDVRPISPHRIRVLVVERRQAAPGSRDEFAVGELLRPSNSDPVAITSIESARRVVESVRGRSGYELIAVDNRRLGLVLGRALAHEIGHYLLDTHTHARQGLMRPQFNAREFTDLRDGIFALDRKASEWLKSRAASDRFAYAN